MLCLPPGCAVRRATPADLARYGAISRRTFRDTYRASHDAAALERHVQASFADDVLAADLASAERVVLAVERDDEWMGYALLAVGAAPAEVAGQRPIEMARFYIERAWQGQGVAAALMTQALELATGAGHDVAWLAVWEQNSRARRFYLRQGFAAVGRATYAFDGQLESDLVLSRAL